MYLIPKIEIAQISIVIVDFLSFDMSAQTKPENSSDFLIKLLQMPW